MTTEKFRLALLFKPSYIVPRLRSIRSPREAARRAADLARYLALGAGNCLYAARGAFMRAWPGAAEDVRWAWRAGRSAALAPVRLAAGLRRELRLYRAVAGYKATKGRERVPNPPPPSAGKPVPAVHLSWNIHVACNYDCPYCWFHGRWGEFAGGSVSLSPAEWARHWDRFNDRHGAAEIHIAGGEPFIYPGFAEIAAGLSRRNVLYVITNLSWDPADVIGKLDPARVGFSASYHAAAAGPADAFAEKVLRLRRAGFHATASIVAYPPYLEGLPAAADAFLSRGIYAVVQPFRGEWRGGAYPGAYTRAERALVGWLARGGHLAAYGAAAAPAAGMRGETEDFGREYMLAPRRTRGLACDAGRAYGRLQFNGDMIRCSQGGYVGNFLKEDFSMAASAAPCPFRRCECVNEVVYVEGGPYGPAVSGPRP